MLAKDQEKLRILMTGASGYLGNLLLQRHAHRLTVTTLGRQPHPLATSHIACNLADSGNLDLVLRDIGGRTNFDAVLHLAVSRFHRDFPQSSLDLFHVNTATTISLLDFAYRTGVRHFCLGSTGSVYDMAFGQRASEHDLTFPKSFFAATKLAADLFAASYRPQLAVSILRFFVPYGPGLKDRMLNAVLNAVRQRRPITVPPAATPMTFAPIFGPDAVDVTVQCLDEVWNDTVNVAGEEIFTVVDAARVMGSVLGCDIEMTAAPSAGSHYLVPDLSRLRAYVDTKRFTSFSEGIAAMLAEGD